MLPHSKLGAFALTWGLRVGFSWAYLWICMTFLFDSVLSTSIDTHGPGGTIVRSGYERNCIMLYTSGLLLLSGLTSLSAALLPPIMTPEQKLANEQKLQLAARKKGGKKPPAKRSASGPASDHSWLDFWDRELDMLVGTIVYLLLTALSILPIASAHSKLLFNRTYAIALSTLNKQNDLVRGLFSTSVLAFLLDSGKLLLALFRYYWWLCFAVVMVGVIIFVASSIAIFAALGVFGAFAAAALAVFCFPRFVSCLRESKGLRRWVAVLTDESEPPPKLLGPGDPAATRDGLDVHPTRPSPHARPRVALLYNGQASWEDVISAASVGTPRGDDWWGGGNTPRGPSSREAVPEGALSATVEMPQLSFEQRWTMLRAYVYPVAAQITHLFGFQRERLHRGHVVPSNLDNQVDHVCKLVLNLMDRQGYDNWSEALHHAITTLHKHLLRNYGRWLRHTGLAETGKAEHGKKSHSSFGSLAQNRTWAFLGPWEFLTIEEEQDWVCSSQLHQVMLSPDPRPISPGRLVDALPAHPRRGASAISLILHRISPNLAQSLPTS